MCQTHRGVETDLVNPYFPMPTRRYISAKYGDTVSSSMSHAYI